MFKKTLVVMSALILTASFCLAGPLSLDDLVNKLKGNQEKIKDMYAETTTTINSTMVLPGAGKGPQKMVQKAKMWVKGETKSKLEMSEPMKQVTVTNGDKMMMVNPATGQKMIQDLKKLRGKGGMSEGNQQMTLEKAKQYFNLTATQKGNDYVITGVPKQPDKFLGKMEFYVDGGKMVPVKVLMYDLKGKLVSQTEIEYQQIDGIWVPKKNRSQVTTPAGTMKMEMEFANIRINKGISDSEFKID
jgi:outer membrane lipoprotein-sorting protein